MTHERLGYRLGHRLTKAQVDLKASLAILERLYTQNNRKGTKFTEEYFDIQVGLQEVYYRENRNKAEPVLDPNDAIFTAILNEEEILRDLEEDRQAGISTRRKLPPPNQKLDRRDLEQTIDDWVDRQAPDSKYKIYENRKIMRELHNIQRGLIQNTIARKKELEAIRSRAVNIGIAEFNELIEKLPIEQRPKELDIRKIKKEGLTLDTFWDHFFVKRAQEEIIRIGIEIAKVFDWIGKETYGATHSDTNGWLRPWTVQRLRHLQNIVTGFLKAQARYRLEISKTQRTMIMELQNRIYTMLTSIWSAGIEVKECIEEEDFGDNDEVIGELLA
ncbi:hypothetical protein BGX38DRAFT_1272517 [Terfezia claveryi]|nr:hypothetical protein BGX38DRAFT_1272517 [Terfezia claveryi]